MARRTPLHDRHVALGATIVEFGGYEMPIQYTGIREEHTATRQRAGLFDLSHMGEVVIAGDGAEAAVQRLVANDVSRLAPGDALYTVMCNERGGIIDDLVVYRGIGGSSEFLIVVNASRRTEDVAWMRAHVEGAEVRDVSDEVALIAVQGPLAAEVLRPLTEVPIDEMRPFTARGGVIAGVRDSRVCMVSRTGYTGEDGWELYVDSAAAPRVWDALLEAGRPHGLLPVGLGARDTLRLEAGLRLYGQDMDESVDPLSCGLGWTVKLAKGDFIGRDALQRIKDEGGPRRRFAGLHLSGRAIARHGQSVFDGDRACGEVTSGTYSFTLGHGIATAYVDAETVQRGGELAVDIRGTRAPAAIAPLPFYKRPTPVRS